MLLYIVRHAEAAQTEGVPKGSDSLHLTAEGRRAAARVASFAEKELGFRPDVIVSSPMSRAKETAEIVRSKLGVESEVAIEDALVWDRPVKGVYPALRQWKRAHSIAIVSHIPLIPRLLADLLAAESRIDLARGGIACVQFERGIRPGEGTLVWMLPPRQWFDGHAWES